MVYEVGEFQLQRGYTFLWRKIWDSEEFFPKGHVYSQFEAWLYLVNHEARGRDDPESGLLRGQFEASCRYLGSVWNWPKSNVHRFLQNLIKNGDIARLGHPAGHLAGQSAERFSVCNYETYNNVRDAKRDSKRTAERNNIKEGLKEGFKRVPSELSPPDGDTPPESTNPKILVWIYRHYNQRLPQVGDWTPERAKKSRTRINRALQKGRLEVYLEEFAEAVKKAQLSPFLRGEESNWKASFDWLVDNDTNLRKVLEGNYDGNIQRKGRPYPDAGLENDFKPPEISPEVRGQYQELIDLVEPRLVNNGDPAKLLTSRYRLAAEICAEKGMEFQAGIYSQVLKEGRV